MVVVLLLVEESIVLLLVEEFVQLQLQLLVEEVLVVFTR